MAQNPSNLPYFKIKYLYLSESRFSSKARGSYFKIKPLVEEKTLANFLLRKFRPKIRKNFPQHYLVQPIPHKTLMFVKDSIKRYSYFLRFDIKLYYPSINHQILIKVLSEIYQNILEKSPSRRFKNYLKNEIPEFLAKSPYGKGIPIGSRLSYALAGLFLLDLDWQIPYPFLRQNDDYLIFCKRKGDAQILLKNIILPKLKELGLELNEKKLNSGKFHQDKVNFIGFEFYAGYIRISEEKIEEFKQRIKRLTYLTQKKSVRAVIKLLNNQLLGFGHYYKFAQAKQIFEELDGFIRARLRRYIQRNKNSRNKQINLVLTNASLKSLGLKSLTEIYQKYSLKKQHKFKKKAKIRQKTGKPTKNIDGLELKEIEFKYQQKLILDQLKELTGLVKKLGKRIANLERKLAH